MEHGTESLPGRTAPGRDPSDFDPFELARGLEHEMEHTTNRDVAREIAMDHLAERPDYYWLLDEMDKMPIAPQYRVGEPSERSPTAIAIVVLGGLFLAVQIGKIAKGY